MSPRYMNCLNAQLDQSMHCLFRCVLFALLNWSPSQVAIGRRDCLSVFGNDYDTIDGTGNGEELLIVVHRLICSFGQIALNDN